MNYTDYRCLEASNFDTTDDESWTQRSSPWATARDCWWPLDVEDTRLCAFDSSSGNHKCDHNAESTASEGDFRWCGSNYDALGNQRFTGGVIEGVEWSAAELTANATFVEDLAWGYTTFDNMFAAFLSIFQSITLEGWSDILYQVLVCVCVYVRCRFYCRYRGVVLAWWEPYRLGDGVWLLLAMVCVMVVVTVAVMEVVLVMVPAVGCGGRSCGSVDDFVSGICCCCYVVSFSLLVVADLCSGMPRIVAG